MSIENDRPGDGTPGDHSERRCPECDTLASPSAVQCLMCGALLPAPAVSDQPGAALPEAGEERAGQPAESAVFVAAMRERQSRLVFWMTSLFTVLLGVVIIFMLQNPIQVTAMIFPTLTPIPPTATLTPTWTPPPTETSPPTDTPTVTPTPLPTDTPPPPRFHAVLAGETMFGLSLRYRITAESIAEANGLAMEQGIVVGQQLQIPWPTATPPLVAIEVRVGEETVIADPANCERYEILSGDSLFAVAARYRVDLNALLSVNRLTDQSIVQPGDSICIPTMIVGSVLPATPGPSPTPTATSAPGGPPLLYPADGSVVEPAGGPLALQWMAVKDLTDQEWYMVELTDLQDVDSHALRGFTRDTLFRVPDEWRPDVAELRRFRWRVSIVLVTGRRGDGGFIYTFGGRSSRDALFIWQGAVPTPTATPDPTPAAEP